MKKFLWAVGILVSCLFVSGCGIKDAGTRTVTYGLDGVTVKSETFKLEAAQLVDLEKEKTRQVCYKQQKTLNKSLLDAVKANPIALAMWEQTKALNNALSLLATGKSYNPCPSSTNSADVEIADAKMYERIYGSGFSLVKWGLGAWAGVEMTDSLVSGLAAGGAIYMNGDGNTLNSNDSFKEAVTSGSTTGDILKSETTEVVEIIMVEPPAN
jgi:hypothetical protein